MIADDLIVQGSICTGFDCVNGESFGADTLRLKENNLRIHFDDTSASGGFPANDWRIVVNDQASGGNSYFAIEDATAGTTLFRLCAVADTTCTNIMPAALDPQTALNTTAIAQNTADIAAHTTAIAQNTADIAQNTADIAQNTSDIAAINTQIGGFTDDI